MRKINLVFDEVYNDVDILLVPDDIAEGIESVMLEFGRWLSCDEYAKYFRTGQGKFLAIGTSEFLWWLNHIRIIEGTKASILEQHAEFDPLLPIAEL